MFQSKWEFGLAAKEALALRQAVLIEEKGLKREAAFDRYDEIAAHVFVWDSQGPIAAGRIFPQGRATGLGSIVVAAGRRAEPFADLVLRILLDKAQNLAGDPVLALLFPGEESLYIPFGFQKVETRPDGRSVYSVPAREIRWHSACQEG